MGSYAEAIYLVASRRAKEKEVVALATNRLDMVEREVVLEYGRRWSIELFFREGKQRLGLGEYQTRSLEGSVKHLNLSLIAFTLLNHAGKKKRRATAEPKNKVLPRLPVEKLQTHLRRVVLQDSLEYLSRPQKTNGRKVLEIKTVLLAA